MVEIKFIPQYYDKFSGNYFLHSLFGNNIDFHHNHFKTFLAVYNTTIETPNRSRYPNFNIRPVFKYINYTFSFIWLISFPIAFD